MSYTFKKVNKIVPRAFTVLKGCRVYVGDLVKVDNPAHKGIHKVIKVAEREIDFKFISVAILNDKGKEVWLFKEECEKWFGEIPYIIDYVVVHNKKIRVGDFIEVTLGIWQGVFKVDRIQQNRYLPCRFKNSSGQHCWPIRNNFRKFDQHGI